MDMAGIQDLDQYGGQRPPVVTFELWTPGPDLACQDLVMESQIHSMWKQFLSHIPSRQGGPEPRTDQ